jgi:four helix bundle protein
MFRFEKLDVWQKSIEFADRVYAVTREFPNEERFGLTIQMRRAAVSISSNLAEGSGRSSDKDFAHFVEIAYGSLMEVVSQSQLAVKQSFLPQQAKIELDERAEELARMLSGLRASLVRRDPSSDS